jgi:hypothetical protein
LMCTVGQVMTYHHGWVVLTEYHELGDLHLLGTISFDPSLSCDFPEAAKSGNIQTCLVSPLNGTEPVLYNMIYIYMLGNHHFIYGVHESHHHFNSWNYNISQTWNKLFFTWSHRISPADNIFLVRSFRDWCRSFTQTWLRNRIVHITLHIIHVHHYIRMFHRVHR